MNPQMNQNQPQYPMGGGQKLYSNHKTVLCSYFERGMCKNGNNCTFAHGQHELREMTQNNMTPNTPPKQIDNDIIEKQLIFIMERLKETYPKNENVHYYLKDAQNYLDLREIETAADVIHKILNNNDLKEENEQQHKVIVEKAKEYGLQLKKLKSDSQPETQELP